MKVLKYNYVFLLFTLNVCYSYVLVTGTQMQDSTDFSIDYDLQFRLPEIHPTIDTLTQDTTIVGKLISEFIESCINDVNPKRILISNGPNYSIGSEVEAMTSLCIKYEPVWNRYLYGQCLIPPNYGDRTTIEILLNSYINKQKKWGVDGSSTDFYKNPKNTLTHELIHSVGINHSPAISSIISNGGATTNDPVNIGDDEKNAYKVIYNGPQIIEPVKTDPAALNIPVIKGQNIHFKAVPLVHKNPSYPYYVDIYRKILSEYTKLKTDTLENDTIKYTWNTSEEEVDKYSLYFFLEGAERIGETTYTENDVNYACDQRPAKSEVFSICNFVVNSPKADSSIVAEIGSYIPVNLKYLDKYNELGRMDKVYNSDKLKVKYKLWYDGIQSKDTIATSLLTDARTELKWKFTEEASDSMININHEDFVINGKYQITAMLYAEENNILKFIDKVDSEEFTLVDHKPDFEYFRYKQADNKESMYTTDHEIGAIYGCLKDENWVDIAVNEIKFYYKYPEETEFTQMSSTVELINEGYNLYNIEFDTGERKDSVRIKVEVTTVIDEQSVKITNEKTFELIDRYLIIDEPKPVGLGFVDFERKDDANYQSKGRIKAETGFDINRYLKSFIDHRTYNNSLLSDLQTPTDTIPTDIYNWPKFYEESKEVEPVKNHVPKEGGVCCEPVNFTGKDESKTLEVYTEQNVFASKIINCKPGKYTEKVRSFDYNWGTEIELTHGEKQDFLIPDWKLKTYGADYRFVPPSEKRDFAGINDNIPLCIWRPAVSGEVIPEKSKLNATVINAYKEGSTTSVFNTSTVCEPEQSKLVEWETAGVTAGFYKVEGVETDILTGTEVKHTTEIQICPLYEHWEYGGDFSPNWDSGFDAGFWGIHGVYAINFATRENLRSYYLEAKYNVSQGGSSELISNTVNLGEYDNYNVQFDFQIGYPAHTIDPSTGDLSYDDLLADHRIEVSKDGGSSWTIIKSAKTTDLSIGPIFGHTFKSYFFNLGKSSEVTSVKIKLVTEGISTVPDCGDSIISVGFDEIVVKYSKGPVLSPPENVTASVGSTGKNSINNTVCLTWEPPQKNKLAYVIMYYEIWRNGTKIGTVSGNDFSFVDDSIKTGEKYNYAIVAKYNVPADITSEGANTLTSLLDCKFWIDLSLYPKPSLNNVTAGTGTEYNNVNLTWTPPACSLEITGYKIYRNDEYIGTTADTTYTDCFLEAGDYSYNVSAIYINPTGETLSSETKSVTVESDMPLPVLEDFEEVYDLPANWISDETPSDPFINWQIAYEHPREGLNLTESGWFAYTGADSDYGTLGSQIVNKLISPTYNFSGIAQVIVSYDYFISKYESNAMTFKLYIKNVTSGSTTLLHTPSMVNMSDWERSPDITVPESYMDCNCQFIFEVITYSTQFIPETGLFNYKGSVSVDNFEIIDTGRALLTPANVNISNNQGTMTITWDAVTGATQYYIYRSLLPDKNYQEIGSSATTSYNDVLTADDDCVFFYKVVSEVTQKSNNTKRGSTLKQKNKALEAVK